MPHDEFGNYYVTMVTPSTPRDPARRQARPVSLCKGCGVGKRGDGISGDYHPGCEPGGFEDRLRASASAGARRGPHVINRTTAIERPTKEENAARPSPRQPLRRARLDQYGNAITWTDTGVIINDLEIIHEPTFDEANREVARQYQAHIRPGVEPRAALALALESVHPVYKRAYLRLPNEG
jgi:hypothetical protein